MNKKIKIIDLLNKIANGEDLPKRIKIQDYVFELSKDYEHYYYNEDVEITHLINHNFSNLNDEVEILEDNAEEQENLGESWKELGKRAGEWAKEFQKGFTESFSDIILGNKKNNTEDIEEIEELKRTQNVYDMTLGCYHDIEKKISNDELADKINEIIRYIKRKDLNK